MNKRALLSRMRSLLITGMACLLLLLLTRAMVQAAPDPQTMVSAAGRTQHERAPAPAGVLTQTRPYTSYLAVLFGPPLPLTCPGYRATYYSNPALEGPVAFEQCEPAPIHYDWGLAGPGHGLSAENFSVRWTGRVHVEAGAYTFSARTDDGMRAWLGNELIIDAWLDQQTTDYRATRTLAAGDYDIRVEYYQKTGAALAEFAWLPSQPGSGVVISQKQGFDKCQFPGTAGLAAWWNKSPYSEFNIYIGGSLSACGQPNLSRENLVAASNQGWNFIPTWVGPQAPCTDYRDKMSADVDVAYLQGLGEADAAANRAQTLGLTELAGPGCSSIVYYDVEYFAGDGACHDAVKSFLAGWTTRLHARGLRAGAYGTPSGLYSPGGAQVDAEPDDIWAAVWTSKSYDAQAGVWDLPGIPNTLWTDHQRIHQYAGGHDEQWGGVTFNIDSNAFDGHVAGINPHPITATLAARGQAGPADLAAAPGVQAAQLLPGGQGWSLLGNRLWWTRDAGSQWADVTPAIAMGQSLRAAHYRDAEHGWLLVAATSPGGPAAGPLMVAGTEDAGQSWFTAPLPPLPADPDNLAHSAAFFSSLGTETGWLALRLPSGSNFSLGALFATTDGGRTWTPLPLPLGGPVVFADALHGWAAGGPAGDELWVTGDGGHTWARQAVGPTRRPGVTIFYGLPAFEDGQRGALPVTVAEDKTSRVEFYRTADGGRSWQAAGVAPLRGGTPGAPVPASVLRAREWLVADPQSGALLVASPSGVAARTPSATPQLQGAVDLQFAGPDVGWALVAPVACSGDKARAAAGAFRCWGQPALLRTNDGGATWTASAP